MSETTTVRAYLNNARDGHGAPLGMLNGYEPGHELALAFETILPNPDDDLRMCEEIFRLLNVGDDPEFGTPDPRAVAYRARGHRSLSIGDLVTIDDRAYACARRGFTAITTTRARVEVENFRTTVVLIDADYRPVRSTRRNVIWTDGDANGCVNAADAQLREIGYQRIVEWTDSDGSQPTHTIGDRNGWYHALVTPAASQP